MRSFLCKWILGPFCCWMGWISVSWEPFRVLGACRDTTAPSGRNSNWHQLSQSHQVVSCGGEAEDPSPFGQAAMFQFTQQCYVFHPAEALLDALSLLLADGIAGVPRGSLVNGAASRALLVLCHMRGYIHMSAFRDKLCRVETLITTHGKALIARQLLQHHQCRVT